MSRVEEAHGFRTSQLSAGVKGIDENSARTTKMGSGNAGQGYTFEEVGTCNPVLSLLLNNYAMESFCCYLESRGLS